MRGTERSCGGSSDTSGPCTLPSSVPTARASSPGATPRGCGTCTRRPGAPARSPRSSAASSPGGWSKARSCRALPTLLAAAERSARRRHLQGPLPVEQQPVSVLGERLLPEVAEDVPGLHEPAALEAPPQSPGRMVEELVHPPVLLGVFGERHPVGIGDEERCDHRAERDRVHQQVRRIDEWFHESEGEAEEKGRVADLAEDPVPRVVPSRRGREVAALVVYPARE